MVRKEKSSFLERYNLLLIAAGAILALLLFSGWEMRRGVVAVRAEKALRQQIATTISTNGKVEPVQNFEAHAPAPATVKRVLVNGRTMLSQRGRRLRSVTVPLPGPGPQTVRIITYDRRGRAQRRAQHVEVQRFGAGRLVPVRGRVGHRVREHPGTRAPRDRHEMAPQVGVGTRVGIHARLGEDDQVDGIVDLE